MKPPPKDRPGCLTDTDQYRSLEQHSNSHCIAWQDLSLHPPFAQSDAEDPSPSCDKCQSCAFQSASRGRKTIKLQHTPPQHITLLRLFQNQNKLVNAVDLVFDALDQRSKSVGDVIDQSVRYPIRRDVDEILQLLDAPPYVARMRRASEMERERTLTKDDNVHVQRLEVGGAVGILIKRAKADEIVISEQLDLLARLLHLNIFGGQGMDAKSLSTQSQPQTLAK